MHDVRRTLFAMSLVTAGVIAFEVALTRVCSVLLQYHISFAVVSYAILGLGLGGFSAYVWTRHHPERIAATADVALLLVAPLMLLALASLVLLPFAAHWPYLLALLLPAFMAAGAFQSLMLRAYAGQAGSLYAADLAGGAAGALVSVLAIGALRGPIQTIVFVALVLSAGAALWVATSATSGRRVRLLAPVLMLLAFACAAGQAATRFLDVSYQRAPHKLITRLMRPAAGSAPRLVPRLQRWDAYSRVDVLERATFGGVERFVFIDGETPTPMLARGALSPGRRARDIGQVLPSLPYRLFAPQQVLSIGSGAGYDVAIATRMGARHVDAVELNAGVLEIAALEKAFTGDVYGQPGVHAHHDEGRLFVRRAPEATYDLIVLALAQSLAGNLREYALSENYLYTREALGDYLRALRPDGTLAMLLNSDVLVRKLARTAIELLDARGLAGSECIAVIVHPDESPYDHVLLVRQQPFDAGAQARLRAEITTNGYVGRHVPGSTTPAEQYAPAALADPAWRMQPASDDRPFFFHVHPELPPGLRPLLWIASVLLLVAWAAAGNFARRAGVPTGGAARAAYFVLLGLAFMTVEVLALQKAVRLVGFPTLNLAVVLSTFLLAAGCGSALSQRIAVDRAPKVLRTLLVALGLGVAALAPLLDLLFARFDAGGVTARCLVVSAGLAPFAFAMGMPFPLALRLLPEAEAARIPWFWGLNGVASILGSAAVVAVVLMTGFQVAALLPVALYVLAALLAGRLAAG